MKLKLDNTWKYLEYNFKARGILFLPTVSYYSYVDEKQSAITFQWLIFSVSLFWNWKIKYTPDQRPLDMIKTVR